MGTFKVLWKRFSPMNQKWWRQARNNGCHFHLPNYSFEKLRIRTKFELMGSPFKAKTQSKKTKIKIPKNKNKNSAVEKNKIKERAFV